MRPFVVPSLSAVLFLAAWVGEARVYRNFKNDNARYSLPPPDQYSGSLVVKFHNGSGMRPAADGARYFRTGVTKYAGDLTRLHGLFSRASAGAPQALFKRPAEELDAERAQAERNVGEELPDLTLFYEVCVSDYQAAAELLDALGTNSLVEVAYARPLPQPLPTADYYAQQTYMRNAAANGYDVQYAWSRRGGAGSSSRLIDIEYQWTYDHEDLQKSATNILWGTPYTAFGPDHGTASLGISAAISNQYGMVGIIHQARVDMISPCDASGYYYLASAINQAVARTSPGDVILLEQQAYNYTLKTYCPVEYWADVYSAIANATALNRVIIEPAGNGATNLDDAAWSGIFQRSTRDSGAIMVGAGQASNRARCSFTCYGSRVDIQGWGDWSVATLGYGDLAGTTATDKYTRTFSGTSSASALSAAVAVSVQSYAKANYGFYLSPLALRSNLVQSGYAQTYGLTGNIGPLPNLSNAYYNVDSVANADPDGDGMPNWKENLAGTDPADRSSYLGITSIAPEAGGTGIVVTWQSVSGKSYQVERGTNLMDALAFGTVLRTNIVGTAPMNVETDRTAVGSGPWLYRIKLE